MIEILNSFGGRVILVIAANILKIRPVLKSKLQILEDVLSNDHRIEIPKYLLHSILSIEDKRFFNHHGVDLYSILRSINNRIWKRRIEGASTITQQLVRVIIKDYEVRISRKFTEIILASLIDKRYSKHQILKCYCSHYLFDGGTGITQLCKSLSLNMENLSFDESYQIAARFKHPFLRKSNYRRYLKRVRLVEIKSISTPNLNSDCSQAVARNHTYTIQPLRLKFNQLRKRNS